MKEGPTLKDNLDALNSILIDLKNVEVKIDDENAALILLVSLPPSFENFEHRNLNPSAYQLWVMIGVDIEHKKENEKADIEVETLRVAAIAKDDLGLECDVVLLVVDYKGASLVWIFDSACSFHMCPNRDWFVTYKEFDGGHVFMGNDSPCKVVSEEKLVLGGEKGIFIGYGDGVNGYQIWLPCERRVILSRNVTFDADYLFHVEHVVLRDADHDDTSPDDHTNSPHLEHEQDRSIAYNRPRRNAKGPSRFSFKDYVAYALQVAKEVELLEPATYQEAITSKESDMWIAAMGEEI
ncbi:hypothetical protein Tco_0132867 [Tanacetum coccineum]